MTAPEGDEDCELMMRWFGASWGAPLCRFAEHEPTPVGEACLECEAPIAAGDQGVLLWDSALGRRVPEHKRCFVRSILPRRFWKEDD